MKKKFLAIAVAGISACTIAALASCGEKPEEKEATYESGYYYANAWSTGFYGLTAKVTVKGDKISALTVSDPSDGTLFNISAGWKNAAATKAAYNAYVQSFVGKTVAEVKAIEVATEDNGQPKTVTGADVLCAGQFGEDDEKTGATQTAGRLILAIQNALNDKGTVSVGSYSYPNPWDSAKTYGSAIAVTVKDGKIAAIASANPNYEKFCNISAGWKNADATKAAYDAYVQSFVGKSVDAIKAMTVETNAEGVPTTVTGVDILCANQFGEGEEKTGATQTTGRIVLALKNALGEKVDVFKAYEGGYYYANSYTTGLYGLTVKVTVKNDKISKITTSAADDANLFNISAGWTNAAATKEAYNAYVQSFVGKTVAEVKAIKVTTKESGQPETVTGADVLCAGQFGEDDAKTGATQTAGRFILALQNALNEKGKVYVGSYSYPNPWNSENAYGATIAVTVKDGKIVAIASANPNYEKFCNISAGWTNAAATKEAYNAYVQSFVGKTVAEIKAMKVTCAENGVPEEVTGVNILCAGQFGEDEEKTGATQTTGRIVLALQAALEKA